MEVASNWQNPADAGTHRGITSPAPEAMARERGDRRCSGMLTTRRSMVGRVDVHSLLQAAARREGVGEGYLA
ncbi:MAG: hypothetical protein R2853_19175 [Thermomicrobiales bacterium]